MKPRKCPEIIKLKSKRIYVMTFKRREFACYCEMYFKCKRIPEK